MLSKPTVKKSTELEERSVYNAGKLPTISVADLILYPTKAKISMAQETPVLIDVRKFIEQGGK